MNRYHKRDLMHKDRVISKTTRERDAAQRALLALADGEAWTDEHQAALDAARWLHGGGR